MRVSITFFQWGTRFKSIYRYSHILLNINPCVMTINTHSVIDGDIHVEYNLLSAPCCSSLQAKTLTHTNCDPRCSVASAFPQCGRQKRHCAPKRQHLTFERRPSSGMPLRHSWKVVLLWRHVNNIEQHNIAAGCIWPTYCKASRMS